MFTRGNHWMSVNCSYCHGIGLADAPPPKLRHRPGGYCIPEAGEEYGPEIRGTIPSSRWGCQN